jgi:uncharacterized protein (TIGR02145 family)
MKSRILLFVMMIMGSFVLNAQTTMNIHQNNGTVVQIPINNIDSITYTISNLGNLATLTTLPIGSIAAGVNGSASSGGNITNAGDTPVYQRGVVWSTSPNPTTSDYQSSDGIGIGSYTSNLIGLNANTTYYVRAYAINNAGTAYGNELSFITSALSNPGTSVTFDGYTYPTILLGNDQEWMAENLRTSIYSNGDSIPNITDPSQWASLTSGAWAHYNSDSQYENPYGKIYNWLTVADPRNVCPSGWHVPADNEWTALTDYLGGNLIAGGYMKSIGTQYWLSPNEWATNESDFSGLPGGYRLDYGAFEYIGSYGTWWSSSLDSNSNAWFRWLYFNDGKVIRNGLPKNYGLSIRCLRD